MPALSNPTVDVTELERLADLRRRAAARLAGAAAAKGPVARAADALTVLHAMASSPTTASDALTLLHELQVHQVEVDLQAQELRESRVELESALRRQVELYDLQPVACFCIDSGTTVHELNLAGAALLGVGRSEACGRSLDACFSGDSVSRFRSALASLDAGQACATCQLTLCPQQGPQRAVLANLGKWPATNRYLVNLTETGEEQALAQPTLS